MLNYNASYRKTNILIYQTMLPLSHRNKVDILFHICIVEQFAYAGAKGKWLLHTMQQKIL